MCSSKTKVTTCVDVTLAKINGRPVLQPNRVPNLDRRNSIKTLTPKSPPLPPPLPPQLTTPISPKSKSPRPPAIKRTSIDTNGMNSSSDRIVIPSNNNKVSSIKTLERKKSKSYREGVVSESSFSYSSSLIIESPGSIAAVRREQMALQQAQRKMKIAHYGRSKSAKFEPDVVPFEHQTNVEEQKRCSFITPNSDPIYVAYHDEEWGVPVHDDKMLLELLVLSGAQVGSDWTSILKKRQDFRNAFSGFDAEVVASLTDKQMMSISSDYGIDISRVRGVFDNSTRILEIQKEFGSFDKYLWGFVNQKPISTNYKFGHKIPVKTSKSESISKDMVKRGFRFVGPTVVHSFMQATGLTNDHLITCHCHLPCSLIAASHKKNP